MKQKTALYAMAPVCSYIVLKLVLMTIFIDYFNLFSIFTIFLLHLFYFYYYFLNLT